jgi:hypothetical protein
MGALLLSLAENRKPKSEDLLFWLGLFYLKITKRDITVIILRLEEGAGQGQILFLSKKDFFIYFFISQELKVFNQATNPIKAHTCPLK